jgi:hypothetical protein
MQVVNLCKDGYVGFSPFWSPYLLAISSHRPPENNASKTVTIDKRRNDFIYCYSCPILFPKHQRSTYLCDSATNPKDKNGKIQIE